MKEFTEEYLLSLNQLIDNKEEEKVKEQIQDLHPADIAELVGDLDDEMRHHPRAGAGRR